jgi:hypothetical protein
MAIIVSIFGFGEFLIKIGFGGVILGGLGIHHIE